MLVMIRFSVKALKVRENSSSPLEAPQPPTKTKRNASFSFGGQETDTCLKYIKTRRESGNCRNDSSISIERPLITKDWTYSS